MDIEYRWIFSRRVEQVDFFSHLGVSGPCIAQLRQTLITSKRGRILASEGFLIGRA